MEPFVMNPSSTRSYAVAAEEIACSEDLEVYRSKNRDFLLPENTMVGQSLKYRLYGVVNHYGSQNFGHYTAFAKINSDEWNEFNDSTVYAIDSSKVVSNGAYILFYERI